MSDKPFFVGYLSAPPRLRGFLVLVIFGLIAIFTAVGYTIALTQADPGPAATRFDYGRQTVTGIIEARPYPVLHVLSGTERVPEGRTILLTGQGKFGVQDRADRLDGALAKASGVVLERGDLDMLQVRGGMQGLGPTMGPVAELASEDLGRWRLAGEICDGKCLAGAMRPGRGLAHRACANLCLAGGVPPVFVSSQPVEGSEFLLIGGSDGGPIPDSLLDLTALYISIEGRIERRGDLLVFLVDPDSAEVLP